MSYKHLSQTELNSYLIKAAKNDHTNTVERLLDCGADIHTNNGEALYLAFKHGYISTADFLLTKGAKIHDSFLLRAAKNGDTDLIKHLLKHGANIHTNNDEALYLAFKHGHISTANFLLTKGAKIHATFLLQGAKNGDTDLIKHLIEHGADIHTNNDEALYLAFKYGHIFTAEFLWAQGADIHDVFLPRAAKDGNNGLIKHLLAHGIDIHTNNDAALQAAARYSYSDTVELLLKHGANIHADDNNSLKTAVKLGKGYIVEILLAHGADVHAGNDNALITAAELGHCYIAKLLLIHGADIHADNDAALRIAVKNGHTKMVWLLLMRGANIHANNDEVLKLAAKGYCKDTDSLPSVFSRISYGKACFDGEGDYANTVVRLAQHYLSIGKKAHLDSLLPTLPESAADLVKELLQNDNLSA